MVTKVNIIIQYTKDQLQLAAMHIGKATQGEENTVHMLVYNKQLRNKKYFLFQNVQTGFGAHLASCCVSTAVLSQGYTGCG